MCNTERSTHTNAHTHTYTHAKWKKKDLDVSSFLTFKGQNKCKGILFCGVYFFSIAVCRRGAKHSVTCHHAHTYIQYDWPTESRLRIITSVLIVIKCEKVSTVHRSPWLYGRQLKKSRGVQIKHPSASTTHCIDDRIPIWNGLHGKSGHIPVNVSP